jgi:hypothetical protein
MNRQFEAKLRQDVLQVQNHYGPTLNEILFAQNYLGRLWIRVRVERFNQLKHETFWKLAR